MYLGIPVLSLCDFGKILNLLSLYRDYNICHSECYEDYINKNICKVPDTQTIYSETGDCI